MRALACATMGCRLIETVLVAGTLLLVACTQDTTVTRGLKDAPKLQAALVEAIPVGSDLTSAVAFMERNLFRCQKRARLDRYKAHLSALYGEERVATISAALQDINNAIGYDEI